MIHRMNTLRDPDYCLMRAAEFERRAYGPYYCDDAAGREALLRMADNYMQTAIEAETLNLTEKV